jgi:hypothetical protein
MDSELRNSLVVRYAASEWLDAPRKPGNVRSVNVAGSLPQGWVLIRSQRNDSSQPPFVISIWRRAKEEDVILSVRVIECTDTAAAREQLLEELGNFESPVIKRRTGADAVGDIAFGLAESMILFARENVVVAILNGGPRVVSVFEVAVFLDGVIQQQEA